MWSADVSTLWCLQRRLTELVAEKVTDSATWQLACERQAKEDALQREARFRMLYMAAQQENVQLSREKQAAELEKQAAEREKEAAEREKVAAEHDKLAALHERLAAERALREQSALRAAAQQEAAQDRTQTGPEPDASAETQVCTSASPSMLHGSLYRLYRSQRCSVVYSESQHREIHAKHAAVEPVALVHAVVLPETCCCRRYRIGCEALLSACRSAEASFCW